MIFVFPTAYEKGIKNLGFFENKSGIPGIRKMSEDEGQFSFKFQIGLKVLDIVA